MVFYQSVDGAFYEFTNVEVESLGCFLDFLLEVPGDGAGKMNFPMWMVVLHHVTLEKVGKTTDEQLVYFR